MKENCSLCDSDDHETSNADSLGSQSSWAAQFAVSKRRILANAYSLYKELDDLIEAFRIFLAGFDNC